MLATLASMLAIAEGRPQGAAMTSSHSGLLIVKRIWSDPAAIRPPGRLPSADRNQRAILALGLMGFLKQRKR